MALVIRLRKQGRRNRQCFRLVVADKRSPRDGKYVEMLGVYDPFAKDQTVTLKEDRVAHWLGLGAQISEKAKALVKSVAPQVLKKEAKKKSDEI